MSNKELVKRAFDSNAWVYDTSSYAQAVAPAMFDEIVREYQEKSLVVAPLGEQIDFTKPGSSWTVTIDAAPTAAALTAETDAAAVSAISNSQVTFTPLEYTKRFDASLTAMEDGFLNFMSNASKKIGYAQAQAKDTKAVTVLAAGAGATVCVNSKALPSDLESTDYFNRNSVLRARQTIRSNYYKPKELVITPIQEAALLNEGSIYKANEFGTRAAIANGLIGNLYGFDIYVSDSIAAADNVEQAIALGLSGSGEKSFGVAVARKPMVESDKVIELRQIKVVGSERYDIKVLHPGAVCLIASYEAVGN